MSGKNCKIHGNADQHQQTILAALICTVQLWHTLPVVLIRTDAKTSSFHAQADGSYTNDCFSWVKSHIPGLATLKLLCYIKKSDSCVDTTNTTGKKTCLIGFPLWCWMHIQSATDQPGSWLQTVCFHDKYITLNSHEVLLNSSSVYLLAAF